MMHEVVFMQSPRVISKLLDEFALLLPSLRCGHCGQNIANEQIQRQRGKYALADKIRSVQPSVASFLAVRHR